MLHKINLLILEDQPEICELIELSLLSQIPNIRIAHSVHEASSLIKQYPFMLAIIDINLPDGNPYELIQDLLQKQCKIIVMSGNFKLDQKINSLSLIKLEKPFRITTLLKKIEEAFNFSENKQTSKITA